MEEKVLVIKQGSAFGTFLRGAVIGATIALLFAPRSGRETRTMLSERGSEMYDKAKYIAQDTRDRAQTVVSDARNKIEDTIQGVKQGASSTLGKTTKDLKREVEIMEDVNNPHYNL